MLLELRRESKDIHGEYIIEFPVQGEEGNELVSHDELLSLKYRLLCIFFIFMNL